MNPGTLNKIEEFRRYQWFSRTGQVHQVDVKFCDSWAEAISKASSVEWGNLQLEGRNQLTRALSRGHRERYRQWNRITEEVKAAQEHLFSETILPFSKQHGLAKQFEDSVRWDLLAICMEIEFEDVIEPPFYYNLDDWYKSGHFPCGWEGEYPQGRLVIF